MLTRNLHCHIVTGSNGAQMAHWVSPIGAHCDNVTEHQMAQWAHCDNVTEDQLTRWVSAAARDRWGRGPAHPMGQQISCSKGSIDPMGRRRRWWGLDANDSRSRGGGTPCGRRRGVKGGHPRTPRTCETKNPLSKIIHNPIRIRNPLAQISTSLATPREPVIPYTDDRPAPSAQRAPTRKPVAP